MKKGSFSITLYRKNSSKTGEAIIMRYKTFEAFQNNEGLPDNYTGGGTSDNQRYKMLGNAFNVDVVAHILSFIPKK